MTLLVAEPTLSLVYLVVQHVLKYRKVALVSAVIDCEAHNFPTAAIQIFPEKYF